LCIGLLHEYKVLLLDEITVDLDVLGRADLLDYLKKDAKKRGACILYVSDDDDGS
jgi:CCR4-NOT complex subunit CAF16